MGEIGQQAAVSIFVHLFYCTDLVGSSGGQHRSAYQERKNHSGEAIDDLDYDSHRLHRQ